MSSGTDRLSALQRIAAFSAAIRGHDLGEWSTADNVAMTTCIRCGEKLCAYIPAVQPEIYGPVLASLCQPQSAAGAAA